MASSSDTPGRLARTHLVLLLSVLFACLPARVLSISLCACNGIVSESACPCAATEPVTDCAAAECSSAGGCGAAAADVGDAEGTGDGDDGCCQKLAIDDLALARESRAETAADDPEPEPRYGGSPAPLSGCAPPVGSMLARATGPPGWLRRALVERASVVLLI